MDPILLSLLSEFKRKVTLKSRELLTEKSQEDLDLREPTTLERFSLLERLMMLESTSLEEKSKREIRLSTNHPRFKDSSLKRD